MLTSKQRAYLRAMANGYDTIFQIGKGGVSENMTEQIASPTQSSGIRCIRLSMPAQITAAIMNSRI